MHHHQGTKVEKLGNPNHAGLPKIIQQESFICALLPTLIPCFTLFGILRSVECTVYLLCCVFFSPHLLPLTVHLQTLPLLAVKLALSICVTSHLATTQHFLQNAFPLPHPTLSNCGDCGRLLSLVRENQNIIHLANLFIFCIVSILVFLLLNVHRNISLELTHSSSVKTTLRSQECTESWLPLHCLCEC